MTQVEDGFWLIIIGLTLVVTYPLNALVAGPMHARTVFTLLTSFYVLPKINRRDMRTGAYV